MKKILLNPELACFEDKNLWVNNESLQILFLPMLCNLGKVPSHQ